MNNRYVYYGTTGLFAFAMTGSGLADIFRVDAIKEAMVHLGYPAYFPVILGVWKVLGAIAITVPGFLRLKEWAYGGFFVALTGAFASHLASGDAIGEGIAPIILLAIGMASWASRPAERSLGGAVFPSA